MCHADRPQDHVQIVKAACRHVGAAINNIFSNMLISCGLAQDIVSPNTRAIDA